MDVPLNTLLVALMFVTILSMGIGNILMTLAGIVNHANSSRRDRVHLSWIVLLLFVHFNVFWNTKAILNADDWQFSGFLLAIAGPVLMFLATSILLTEPPESEPAKLSRFFDDLGRRFYTMFAALQVWIVLVSRSLNGAFVAGDIVNVVFFALAVILAFQPRRPFQVPGAWIAWALGLVGLGLRWIE